MRQWNFHIPIEQYSFTLLLLNSCDMVPPTWPKSVNEHCHCRGLWMRFLQGPMVVTFSIQYCEERRGNLHILHYTRCLHSKPNKNIVLKTIYKMHKFPGSWLIRWGNTVLNPSQMQSSTETSNGTNRREYQFRWYTGAVWMGCTVRNTKLSRF